MSCSFVFLKLSDFIFILLVAVNTYLSLDGTVRVMSSQNLATVEGGRTINFPPDNRNIYDHIVICTTPSCSQSYATGCERGVELVQLVCSFRTESTYVGVAIVWAVYFFCLVIVRYMACRPYAYNDYRFLLFVDQFNLTKLARFFTIVGVLLTLATVIVGYVKMEFPEVGTIWSIIMFGILNIKGLYLSASLAQRNDNTFEKFTVPIPIKTLPGGNGFVNVLKCTFSPAGLMFKLVGALKEGRAKELSDNANDLDTLVDELMKHDTPTPPQEQSQPKHPDA
eukprot:PhF_6_TR25845/c0_g1_i1/m.36516